MPTQTAEETRQTRMRLSPGGQTHFQYEYS